MNGSPGTAGSIVGASTSGTVLRQVRALARRQGKGHPPVEVPRPVRARRVPDRVPGRVLVAVDARASSSCRCRPCRSGRPRGGATATWCGSGRRPPTSWRSTDRDGWPSRPACASTPGWWATSWSSGRSTGWSCGTARPWEEKVLPEEGAAHQGDVRDATGRRTCTGRATDRRTPTRRTVRESELSHDDTDHCMRRHPSEPRGARVGPRPGGCRPADATRPGLAAVARHDVHIERVWPMRSPSTGALEESSSAHFQVDVAALHPHDIAPVGGLRMSQAFTHEPVMVAEVVELLRRRSRRAWSSMPPSAAAVTPRRCSRPHPGIHAARDRPRSRCAWPRPPRRLAPFGRRAARVATTRFDASAPGRTGRRTDRSPDGRIGLAAPCSTSGSARHSSTRRTRVLLPARRDHSTCGWTRPRAAPPPTSSTQYDEDLTRAVRRQRRGPVRPAHRPGHRGARPITTTGQLAEVVAGRHPRRHPPHRRTPGPPGLPGHPDRGQRGARAPAGTIADGHRAARPRRAVRRHLVPLRRGPAGQVRLHPRGRHRQLPVPAGPPVRVRRRSRGSGSCSAGPGARRPDEVERNHRAESARLRVVERVEPVAADLTRARRGSDRP